MPISPAQRQAIIAAIKEGLATKDIAAQVGVSPGTVAAVKANLSRRPTTLDDVEDVEGAEEEVANAVDTAFGLERDLQKALRENIEQLEPGLTISDGGKEQTVLSGPGGSANAPYDSCSEVTDRSTLIQPEAMMARASRQGRRPGPLMRAAKQTK